LLEGVNAIEFTLSAENAGDEVVLNSDYDTDTADSVSEEATASFDSVEIEDSREAHLSGNDRAAQTYQGSSVYAGRAFLEITGGSGSITGSATLKPNLLSAVQHTYASGNSVTSGMAVMNEGDFASTVAAVQSGSLSASQNAWTGSAHVSSNVHASGDSVAVQGYASDGQEAQIVQIGTSEAEGINGAFDGSVSSYSGSSDGASANGHIAGALKSWAGSTETGFITRDSQGGAVEADLSLSATTQGIPGGNNLLPLGTDWLPGASDRGTFYVNPAMKIQSAIHAAHDGEEIRVVPGNYYEHDIDVYKSLYIAGAGAGSTVVDAQQQGRVFQIDPSVQADISGMTIQNGKAQDGGGIANYGTLSLRNSLVTDNVADQYGGGVYNKGSLNMQGSTVTRNTAGGGTGITLLPMGTPILSPNDDDATGMMPLGFTFALYGQSFDQFSVGNNGFITFTRPSYVWDGRIPEEWDPLPKVAPFYSDIDTRSDKGDVRLAQGVSSRGNPVTQIDWNNVGGFGIDANLRNTFTLYIEQDSAGDIVAFDYRDMQWTNPDYTAIGFDGGNGGDYLRVGAPNDLNELAAFTNTRYVYRMDGSGRPVQISDVFGGGGGIYSEGTLSGNPAQVHGNEAPTGTPNDIVEA
jgi:hypothetical protein